MEASFCEEAALAACTAVSGVGGVRTVTERGLRSVLGVHLLRFKDRL